MSFLKSRNTHPFPPFFQTLGFYPMPSAKNDVFYYLAYVAKRFFNLCRRLWIFVNSIPNLSRYESTSRKGYLASFLIILKNHLIVNIQRFKSTSLNVLINSSTTSENPSMKSSAVFGVLIKTPSLYPHHHGHDSKQGNQLSTNSLLE